MNLIASIVSSWLATVMFWSLFAACVDAPHDINESPAADVILQWNPVVCGPPHRVVFELESIDGGPLSSSVPCAIGTLTLEVPHFGIYLGRVYSWYVAEPIRSVTPMRLYVDEPVMRWLVPTPL